MTSDDLDLLSGCFRQDSGNKDAGDSLFVFDDEPAPAKDTGAWELDDDAGVETFTLDETPFEKIEEEDASVSPLVELSDDLSLDFELETGDEAVAEVSEPDEGIDFSGLSMEKDEPEELKLEPVEAAVEAASEPDEEIDFSDLSMEKDELEELKLEPVEAAVEAVSESDEEFDFSDMSLEKGEPEELKLEPVEAAVEAVSESDEETDIADLSLEESGPEDMDAELLDDAAETADQAAPEIESPNGFEFDSTGEEIGFSIDEPAEVPEETESEIKASPMLEVDDLENGLNDLEYEVAVMSMEPGRIRFSIFPPIWMRTAACRTFRWNNSARMKYSNPLESRKPPRPNCNCSWMRNSRTRSRRS